MAVNCQSHRPRSWRAGTHPIPTAAPPDPLGLGRRIWFGFKAGPIAGALRVGEFLRAYGVVFEGEFATVSGYVIVDLGMRMLAPRELFRCQGFPEDYVIDRAWVVNPQSGEIEEVKLTKEQ